LSSSHNIYFFFCKDSELKLTTKIFRIIFIKAKRASLVACPILVFMNVYPYGLLIHEFGFAEFILVRQNASELAFALTYS